MSRNEQDQDQIAVVLPDDSELTVPRGSSVEAIAYEIGPGLGEDTVGGRIDGELVGKEVPVETDGARIEIVTADSDEYVRVLRHTAAHTLAQAVQRLYDDVQLGIGPPTDEGFYYDFDNIEIDAEDLSAIREEMTAIADADYDVEYEEVPVAEARDRLADQPYKLELLEELAAADETVSMYSQGGWADLCKGPHVDSTAEIGAVDLLEIAGAYWRGDETNPMQTRIYGTAFETDAELESYKKRRREAEQRDHRKLGRELNLFSIQDRTGPGLPLYHPPGKTVLRELRRFVEQLNNGANYEPRRDATRVQNRSLAGVGALRQLRRRHVSVRSRRRRVRAQAHELPRTRGNFRRRLLVIPGLTGPVRRERQSLP
jgi:Threonyl-tRNA synthetase